MQKELQAYIRQPERLGDVELSIQASPVHYSSPRGRWFDVLEDYTHLEVRIMRLDADGRSAVVAKPSALSTAYMALDRYWDEDGIGADVPISAVRLLRDSIIAAGNCEA